MCGILGQINFSDDPVDPQELMAMNATMTSRGPDGVGLYVQGRLGFGHRRLKVIDLTQASQQPMVDSKLGLGIVFNGAIYNYKDLRKELETKGYTFFSHGDTEVILKAYHAWGEDFIHRLNGMFAFAIWERDSERVVLARDRLGIKPLYFTETSQQFRFASTLPALLAGGNVSTEMDPVALHHYFMFHAVVPAPHTLLKSIRKLAPGTMMVIEPTGAQRQQYYWQLSFEPREDERILKERDWQDRLYEVLRSAVRRRLIADVPVGVLLSGGLDSSLIVGLLAAEGATGLNTFSIGFETVAEEKGDEFSYSDIIANEFSTRHHKLPVDTTHVLPNLPGCIHAMSEPMVSHDAIGFYLLSKEVSKHVTVVQSGQGADEIFAGYHWYPPLLNSQHPVDDYRQVFFDRDQKEFRRVIHPRFHEDDHSQRFVEKHFSQPGASRPIDKALRLDTTIMLVDDPVKRVDNMTMAWSLEARVPFLDHEVVELAARVPAEMKIAQGGKGILKEVARRVIPSEVIDRPKGYFPVPALKYLRGPYLDMVKDALVSETSQKREIIQRDYIDELLKNPDDHLTPLRGSKLWQLGLLELWLQSHGI
ncbi:MAG TPA: N-acetylglutaminylglutamine amidotransferase [Nitrospirales bacterium]|nr:N-acetylglutaminylglutamine amidotransferase [Nitrospirales bacterium]